MQDRRLEDSARGIDSIIDSLIHEIEQLEADNEKKDDRIAEMEKEIDDLSGRIYNLLNPYKA
jgi:cell division septum initiation protein DivIVA